MLIHIKKKKIEKVFNRIKRDGISGSNMIHLSDII